MWFLKVSGDSKVEQTDHLYLYADSIPSAGKDMAASLEVMQWKSRSLPTIDCCTEATIAEEEAFNREKRLPAEALIEFMLPAAGSVGDGTTVGPSGNGCCSGSGSKAMSSKEPLVLHPCVSAMVDTWSNSCGAVGLARGSKESIALMRGWKVL